MPIRTIHIRGFDSAGPVCGAGGHVRADEDWATADKDPRFKRCRRCEKKLGPGGLERLQEARKELAAVRAARMAGEEDARARRPSQASAYPVDSPEAQSYRQGYDTGQVEQHPEKEAGIRATTSDSASSWRPSKRRRPAHTTTTTTSAASSPAPSPAPTGALQTAPPREAARQAASPSGSASTNPPPTSSPQVARNRRNTPAATRTRTSARRQAARSVWGDPFRRAGAAD